MATEAADTAIEAGLFYVADRDIFIPTSPADFIQDGFKFLLKQGVKKTAKELGEKGIKGTANAKPLTGGATGVVAPKKTS